MNRRGLSFVELLVAAAVLGTLALAAERLFSGGIAAWSFTGNTIDEDSAVRMAVIQLQSDLKGACTKPGSFSLAGISREIRFKRSILPNSSDADDVVWRFADDFNSMIPGSTEELEQLERGRVENNDVDNVNYRPVLSGLRRGAGSFRVDTDETGLNRVNLVTVRFRPAMTGAHEAATLEIKVFPRN